ncbi:MAG TPA: RNA methyltransferase [Paludibacteraceae bacterium]|nr:RNA methyltransferase [Paludibacteraceae bacterium]HPT42206.1 RNA methyltransferase [Paludibacteraceae bacterium]
MISKSKIKWIRSLEMKKNRDEQNLFVAEGVKLVSDLLPHLRCRYLAVCTDSFDIERFSRFAAENEQITTDEYKKITFQKSPQGVLAVFEKPAHLWDEKETCSKLSLALDDIQDPGNLGTIIRLADWFSIEHVFCSTHSADVFNPKTIQATMGAIANVKVHYVELPLFLRQLEGRIPVYGTFMDGENIYDRNLQRNGIIVMGNEGQGISAEVEQLVTERLQIPCFAPGTVASESLNVGIATAITVAEFRRQTYKK